MSVNSTDSHRPKQVLADLGQAMGEAAISAREAALDHCHSDARAYTERLRVGTSGGAGDLHGAAATGDRTLRADTKGNSAAGGDRRVEAERRHFLDQRLPATGPLSLVTIAARMPNPPAFVAPDPGIILRGSRQGHGRGHGQAPRAESTDRDRMDPGMAFAPRTNSRPRSGQQG